MLFIHNFDENLSRNAMRIVFPSLEKKGVCRGMLASRDVGGGLSLAGSGVLNPAPINPIGS